MSELAARRMSEATALSELAARRMSEATALNSTTSTAGRRLRVRAAAVLAAAVAAGAALAGASPAQAVPGVPSAVFDPDSVSWLSLRDQSSAGFASSFEKHAAAGYLITDLEIDVNGSDYRVGSVWQRNTDGRAWKELRDMSLVQFQKEWSRARRSGMRLVEQETYVVNGSRRYAGVWVENVEQLGWTSYSGLTSADFSQKFAEQRRAGRTPTDIDVYQTGAGLRYAVIWVDNVDQLD